MRTGRAARRSGGEGKTGLAAAVAGRGQRRAWRDSTVEAEAGVETVSMATRRAAKRMRVERLEGRSPRIDQQQRGRQVRFVARPWRGRHRRRRIGRGVVVAVIVVLVGGIGRFGL